MPIPMPNRPVARRRLALAAAFVVAPLLGAPLFAAAQDATGPWVVSWYDNLAAPGQGRNVVMAGHIDYWNVGPAVFYHLADLQPGDAIRVIGQDGTIFTYDVQWVKQFDAADAPLGQIV